MQVGGANRCSRYLSRNITISRGHGVRWLLACGAAHNRTELLWVYLQVGKKVAFFFLAPLIFGADCDVRDDQLRGVLGDAIVDGKPHLFYSG